MNVSKARAVLADPNSSFSDKFRATAFLTHADGVSFDCLIQCLSVGGVCTEMAAMRLHSLTSRDPTDEGVGLITDPEDWREYLAEKGIEGGRDV